MKNNDRVKTVSLSQSTLNIYLNCKRCFWLHFNRKIPRPRGIFSSLPIGMDTVIKDYFNSYRAKGKMPPILEGKIEGKLAKIPLNFKFEDRRNELLITGRLDECIELGGSVYIPLDHKTKGSAPESIEYSHMYYKTQASTYTLLLRENGYKTENMVYIVYYSPAKGELHDGVPFEIEIHKIETDPEEAHRLFIEAKNLLSESDVPEPSKECEYCNWANKVSIAIKTQELIM